MAKTDCCVSFYLKNGLAQGSFCRLSDSITESLSKHDYPPKINELLVELAVVSACFTAQIKSDFRATMQLTGDGPVKIALVDYKNNSFRCYATFSNEKVLSDDGYDLLTVPELFGKNSNLVFTIEFEGQRYQTVVGLQCQTLQECFYHYLLQSEQIDSLILLNSKVSNNKVEAAALVLQKMPLSVNDTYYDIENTFWNDAKIFTATIKPTELLAFEQDMSNLICLVYNELSPIVSRETFLRFSCGCSKERLEKTASDLNISPENLEKSLEIICEYCGKKYFMDIYGKVS